MNIRSIRGVRGLDREQVRQKILKATEQQFAATGVASTTVPGLANSAGVSKAVLYSHFGSKQNLFRQVVQRNAQDRLAALRDRFFAMPEMPPLECIESLAESTILACVDDIGNASVMAWALMELPEFAADIYRAELGATEALWDAEISTRLPDSPLRTCINVRLVPYAVRVSMAFGLWLATLRHKPATAREHARQFTGGIVDVARMLLNFSPASALPGSLFAAAQIAPVK
jgi:AcrR family transcriptional regulator